jgi:hypothetical protein
MQTLEAAERVRYMSKAGVVSYYVQIQKPETYSSEIMSTLYDRFSCEYLGINYADVREIDVLRTAVFFAFVNDEFQ